jgi:hypothetical protein
MLELVLQKVPSQKDLSQGLHLGDQRLKDLQKGHGYVLVLYEVQTDLWEQMDLALTEPHGQSHLPMTLLLFQQMLL